MDFTFEGLSWGDIYQKFEKVCNSNDLIQIPVNCADLVGQRFRDIINEVAGDWLYPADDFDEESDAEDLIDEDILPKISKRLNEVLEQQVSVNNLTEDLSSNNETDGDLVSKIGMNVNSCLGKDLLSKNEIDGDSVSELSKSVNEVFTKISSEKMVSTCHRMDPDPLSLGNSSLIAPSSQTQDSCPKEKIDEQKSKTLPTRSTNCLDVIKENCENSLSAVASLDGAISTSSSADENLKTCGSTKELVSVRSCLVNEHELPMRQDKLETDATGSCRSTSVEGMLPIEETGGRTQPCLEVEPTFPTGCPININEIQTNHGKSEVTEMDCCQSKSVEDFFDEGVNSKNLPGEFEDVDLSGCQEDDEDFQFAFHSRRESRPSSLKKKISSSVIRSFRKLTGRKVVTSSYRHAAILGEQGRQGKDLPAADLKECCVSRSLDFDWEML